MESEKIQPVERKDSLVLTFRVLTTSTNTRSPYDKPEKHDRQRAITENVGNSSRFKAVPDPERNSGDPRKGERCVNHCRIASRASETKEVVPQRGLTAIRCMKGFIAFMQPPVAIRQGVGCILRQPPLFAFQYLLLNQCWHDACRLPLATNNYGFCPTLRPINDDAVYRLCMLVSP